ncbi:ABC transporter permease [Fictibacillus sp. Mic-4]|uniref:ABC transporter permease n=1 Tax=Fictibacillus sp. Mic-4 TaxID=3132826 RepID=UPI003CEE194C
MKFLSLVHNEWIKIVNRPRTWIFIILPILLLLGVGIYTKTHIDPAEQKHWREGLAAQVKEDKKQLEESEENDDPEEIIAMQERDIKEKEYALKHNVPPEKMTTWKFMKNMSWISMLLGLFVIIVASDIVSSEFARGTIKMLLIRPYSRWKILLSKLVTTLIFSFALWIGFVAASWLIGGVLFGFGGFDQPYLVDNGHAIYEKLISTYVFENIGLHLIEFTVLVVLAFLISTIFYSNAIAIGVSMLVMLAGNTILLFIADKPWAKYTLFANLDLTQFIDKQETLVEGLTLPFSLTVLAIYAIVMLAITFAIFQKRDVTS